MASYQIHRLDSGKFKATVRFDDRTQKSKTADTRKAVRTWAEAQVDAAEQGLNPDGRNRPFKVWVSQWWAAWSTHPMRSPNAIAAYQSRLDNHIHPFFDKLRLGQITPMTCQTWQNGLPLARSTIMNCRTVLHTILQAAVNEKLIPDNPMDRVAAPEEPYDEAVAFNEVGRAYFEPEELGLLLAAAGPHWADVFITHVATGLRPSELVGLQRHRVDLLRRELRVVEVGVFTTKFKGLKDRPKSRSSMRRVPLAAPAVEAIARHLPANAGPSMLVFTGPGGGFGRAQGAGQGLSTGSYRLAFNRAVDRAGGFPELELSGTKSFRHTFSTWLEDAGIPARVIAELMGHKPGGPLGPTSRAAPADYNAVTAGYTHTTPAMLDRVLAAIEERLATAVAVAVAAPDRGPAPGRRTDLEAERQRRQA